MACRKHHAATSKHNNGLPDISSKLAHHDDCYHRWNCRCRHVHRVGDEEAEQENQILATIQMNLYKENIK